jgi:hypothetical protein
MPREGFVALEDMEPPRPPERQARPQPQPQQPATAPEPPEPPEPLEFKTEWPIVVKLRHKSIHGNKREQLEQLTFREPTGADILRVGNPVWINTVGEIMFDERKMTGMMAQLSGVLYPLLEAMHPQDWNSCAYRLRRFFLPDPEAW